jgi:hypothetical protein
MNYRHYWTLALLLSAAQPVSSATQERDLPDKVMLRMIDFLRDMEMIKQMEMMRGLQQLEAGPAQANNSAPRKAAPSSKKETPK